MTSELADIKKDFNVSKWVAFISILLIGVGSVLILTLGRGLDSEAYLKSFQIYFIIGGIGLGFYIISNFYNFVTRKRNIRTIFHEPDESLLKGVVFVRNPWLLFLFSFLFVIPIYLSAKKQIFFSSIPLQQITKVGEVWQASFLPSFSENLLVFVLLGVVYTLLFKYVRRKSIALFWFLNLLIVPLVFAFLWVGLHTVVYGGNEQAQIFTFVFGFIGVFLSMLTLSFIPFFVLHFLTNFVLALKVVGWLGSDFGLFFVILFSVVDFLLIVYLVGRKK